MLSRAEITTKRCPCCKYEYQETKYYKEVVRKGKKVVSRIRNGKSIAKGDEIGRASYVYRKHGYIPVELQNKCKIAVVDVAEEQFDREETTKGDEDFIFVEEEVDTFTTKYGSTSKLQTCYFGMFCPKCGVFLNTEICTTKDQRKLL